jgi:hypothetical protein
MKTALVAICIAVTSLGVTACDGSEPGPEPADETLIEYTRSGGFVGLDDHLVIHTDGSATLERREGPAGVTISDEEFEAIEELVAEVAWDALEGDHPPLDNILVADGYYYEFVYDDVTVTTQTAGVPPELEPLIAELDSVIAG